MSLFRRMQFVNPCLSLRLMRNENSWLSWLRGALLSCTRGGSCSWARWGQAASKLCKIGQRRLRFSLPHTWLHHVLTCTLALNPETQKCSLFSPFALYPLYPLTKAQTASLWLYKALNTHQPHSHTHTFPHFSLAYTHIPPPFLHLLLLLSLLARPFPTLLLDSAQLPNFSHHRTLTNIPHDEALQLTAYFATTLTLSPWRMHKVGWMDACVSVCVCMCVSSRVYVRVSSNADQYHCKVTLKFN